MSRIFNVRMTDEQYQRLVAHAQTRGVSMSGMVKEWIARPPIEGRVHAACDARIADLEARLRAAEPF